MYNEPKAMTLDNNQTPGTGKKEDDKNCMSGGEKGEDSDSAESDD